MIHESKLCLPLKFNKNRFGACGMQPAALAARNIGIMQERIVVVCIIFKLCMPLSSALRATQSGGMQLRPQHTLLGAYAWLVTFYKKLGLGLVCKLHPSVINYGLRVSMKTNTGFSDWHLNPQALDYEYSTLPLVLLRHSIQDQS